MVIRIVLIAIAFLLLTLATQVGGLVFLLTIGLWILTRRKVKKRAVRVIAPILMFVFLYLLSTFLLIPSIARSYGRIPLPVFERDGLAPLNAWTCLLNRHYVRRELSNAAFDVAKKMAARYPGNVVHYLDASFPLIDGFPLPPHLSHNDGKRLDLSFHYINKQTGERSDESPSFIGYGICEGPKPGEEDMPATCESQGYWQYSLLQEIVPQGNKALFEFDRERTKSLIYYFSRETDVSKIFLESHLQKRLGLTHPKIKFHGCRAVRHDDHVHVQVY